MRLFFNAGPTNCSAFIIICSRNVQNSLHSTFSCFFHPHLLKYSYHPVSLSLLCPLSLIPPLSQPPFFFFFLNHSFFIALTVPSILLPAHLHPFFLTSLSHSSLSFNLGYFLHRSPLCSLFFFLLSLTIHALLFFICAFLSFHIAVT